MNLAAMYFPITAIASIFHRVSGVFLFLSMPLIMYSLSVVKKNETLEIAWLMPLAVFLIWAVSSLFVYHSLAGVRHLLADFGVFESYHQAKITAWSVIVISVLFALLFAGFVWL
tara:strand:- start:735 stop:1076 length:342 start_codon:yes stop_codon:yes gene_type:complete